MEPRYQPLEMQVPDGFLLLGYGLLFLRHNEGVVYLQRPCCLVHVSCVIQLVFAIGIYVCQWVLQNMTVRDSSQITKSNG